MLPFTGWPINRKRLGVWLSGLFFHLILLLTLFISIIFLMKTDVHPVAADVPFGVEFRGTGNYGFVANGVGTRGDPYTDSWTGEGTFAINVPATATIIKARLIWTGRSRSVDTNGVQLARDGVPLGTFTADPGYQFLQNPWFADVEQIHESKDITALVLPGDHMYTVSGHEHGLTSRDIVNPPNPTIYDLNYGAGIWVVYQDANEPNSEVVIYQGQDSFFRDWVPPRGPHTEVRCATFTPDNTNNRVADVTHLVSGVDTYDSGTNMPRLRSVAFWYESGNGAMPPADEIAGPPAQKIPALSLRPNAIGLTMTNQFPIQSYANLEWDNFNLVGGVDVPAGDDWACFQIESGDRMNLSGLVPDPNDPNAPLEASGMWNLFAIRIRVPAPSAIDLISFTGKPHPDRKVTLTWETADEINNYGFNLYRGSSLQFADATFIRFEPSVFAGSGTVYRYDDTVPGYGSWYYWLEDIDTESGTTLHGPYLVEVTPFQYGYLPLVLR